METTQKKSGNPNFKQKWKHGETTHVRVPIALKDEAIKILLLLDEGLKVEPIKQDQSPENLEEIKLKILKSLKLGQQSVTYKKVEQALNQFIEEVF